MKLTLQLNAITFNRHADATALSVLIRSILLSPVIPNFLVLSGMHLFHQLIFSGEYFEHVHALSCSPWKKSALSVGHIFAGTILPWQHMWRYFRYMQKFNTVDTRVCRWYSPNVFASNSFRAVPMACYFCNLHSEQFVQPQCSSEDGTLIIIMWHITTFIKQLSASVTRIRLHKKIINYDNKTACCTCVCNSSTVNSLCSDRRISHTVKMCKSSAHTAV